MGTNSNFTVILISTDKIFAKALSILMDLFYKTNVYQSEFCDEQSLDQSGNINPEFILIDSSCFNISKTDLGLLNRKFPDALLCCLFDINYTQVTLAKQYHQMVDRKLFFQNFRESVKLHEQRHHFVQNYDEETHPSSIIKESIFSGIGNGFLRKKNPIFVSV
jgi:hypothetical protein